MATTSITPDIEATVTGVERVEEQRFQHARDCEGTLSRPAAPRQLRSGTASEQRAAWVSRDNSSHRRWSSRFYRTASARRAADSGTVGSSRWKPT